MNQPDPRDANLKPAASISSAAAQIPEARERGAGISSPGGGGFERKLRHQSAKRCQDDDAAGFAAWNGYVERNGLRLAKYRKF
jgi:post-segregation antitoxin (ccd killing protein)